MCSHHEQPGNFLAALIATLLLYFLDNFRDTAEIF